MIQQVHRYSMARLGNNMSSLWECSRSIEDYCAQRTSMLLKYIDGIFADMNTAIENVTQS